MNTIYKGCRWIFIGVISICLLLGLNALYNEFIGDFNLVNITYDLPNASSTEILPFNESELNQIFDQRFYYLGEGKQTYAFYSVDGQFVLKFFKFKHLKPSFFIDFLPAIKPVENYKKNLEKSQRKHLEGLFTGYELAYKSNRDNSGLLFIHLNKTKNMLNKTVWVFDKIGWKHKVDLDQVVFVLQKKGEKTKKILKDLLDRQDLDGAKAHIGALFDLYLSEYKNGIYDRDHNIIHNTGFIGSKPFRLDVGRLRKESSMKNSTVAKKDLEKIAWERIDLWMKKYYPQNRSEVRTYMQEKLAEVF